MAKQNIKVLIVPTETGNNIDQNSTVKEILQCEETLIYDNVGRVFQDLNDENLSDRYWFFLVDVDTLEHLNEH